MKKRSTIREWGGAVLVAIIIVIAVRTFVIEGYFIPSASMEKTLLTGDFILVSKIDYGPRTPITPVAYPFSEQTLPFTRTTNSYLSWIQLPYFRLPGFTHIKRNDVVVFNYPAEDNRPVDHRTNFIKRCVALPGDTFEIRSTHVFINHKLSDSCLSLEFSYHVKTNPKVFKSDTLDKMGITEGGPISESGDYILTLDSENVEQLRLVKGVEDIALMSEKKGNYSDMIFPKNKNFPWNVDNYGPMIIPKKGATVSLSADSLYLYKRIIVDYEKNTFEEKNDSIFINGTYCRHYTFKMNYYFMLGDNRNDSEDSRYWGFVPENHIIGKASLILFSVQKKQNNSHIRWNRCFKWIH
ncbi:MAG: signal peptidase I [Bacteroidia bacterium]